MIRFSARAAAWFLFLCFTAGAAQSQDLVPLPDQPPDTAFPTENWAEFDANDPLRIKTEEAIAGAFEGERPGALARSKALLIVWRGKILAERYADGITATTRLQSWSMAKSVLHAALGIASTTHGLSLDQIAPVTEWQSKGDPRRQITIKHLAQMTDGLGFEENYGDPNAHVMQMLFGAGRGDTGSFAAKTPSSHFAGVHWNYSGGSANILSRVLRDKLGGKADYYAFLRERLLLPIGMESAVPEFDASGTWIASSYIHATARDFARFGLLYLRGGNWEGKQIVPRTWVEVARTPTKESLGAYGALFWLNAPHPETGANAISNDLPSDLFMARGFGGQFTAIIPSKDAVVVMLNAAYDDDVRPIIRVISGALANLPD